MQSQFDWGKHSLNRPKRLHSYISNWSWNCVANICTSFGKISIVTTAICQNTWRPTSSKHSNLREVWIAIIASTASWIEMYFVHTIGWFGIAFRMLQQLLYFIETQQIQLTTLMCRNSKTTLSLFLSKWKQGWTALF